MRAILVVLVLATVLVTGARAQVPPLVAAATVLEKSAAESLAKAHAFFEDANDTQAAWVLVREVATFRAQSHTLIVLVTPPNAHLDVARKTLASLQTLSLKVQKLLEDPNAGPEDQILAVLAAWTKTQGELAKVVTAMAAPTHP